MNETASSRKFTLSYAAPAYPSFVCAALLMSCSGCASSLWAAEGSPGVPRGLSSPAATAAPEPEPEISAQSFLRHVEILAHDDLEGRGTGSRGIDLAAGYIAGQFAAARIEPAGDRGTYFQTFTIPGRAKLLDDTALSIDALAEQPALRKDFVPLFLSAQGEFSGEVAFAGYGISHLEKDYDDYAGVDVTGKIVLALRREPPSFAENGRPSSHATFERKIERAARAGAAAILFVSTEPKAGDVDSLVPFRGQVRPGALPAMHISRPLADQLLLLGGLPGISELEQAINSEVKPVSAPLKAVFASGKVNYEYENLTARNVIGVIPGHGPHAHEYVVIGAHYDHLGIRNDKIYNGADDNASGTAGVIEACRYLARMPHRDRSILCMAFTAEEIGLLGSEHFTAHSTVPLDSIKTMINMDMIGRWTPGMEENELAIQGLGTGGSFSEIVNSRTKAAGIDPLSDPSALGPSDHASFYEAGVPSLFFFTGVHSDYHLPGDDTDKINAQGGARISALVARITLDLVNAPAPPQFAEVKQPARILRGASPGGVVMGIMPDMDAESNEAGWGINEVMQGGGAEKAGMKSGDRILSVDGKPVNNLDEYRSATSGKKPGDVVPVLVRRGAEELTLHVELAARRE